MKEIIEVYNWFIDSKDGTLFGYIFESKDFGNDIYVNCTSVENIYMLEDVLFYETNNFLFKCPFKYIDINKILNASFIDKIYSFETLNQIIEVESEINNQVGFSELTKKIVELSFTGKEELAERKSKKENELLDFLTENELRDTLYIELSNVLEGNMLAYSITDFNEQKMGIVYPFKLSQLASDKIIYTGSNNEFEFIYIPFCDEIEIVSWSRNIKSIFIKNILNTAIYFDGFKINPQELKEFKRDVDYLQKEVFKIED